MRSNTLTRVSNNPGAVQAEPKTIRSGKTPPAIKAINVKEPSLERKDSAILDPSTIGLIGSRGKFWSWRREMCLDGKKKRPKPHYSAFL